MLAAGVSTISFEPNPDCFAYFSTVCEMNGFKGRWEQIAVGDRFQELELVYPKTDTWLGSLELAVQVDLKREFQEVEKRKTVVKPLDDYCFREQKILIKIDVEGFELECIEGASRTLRTKRPLIVFESNSNSRRRNDLYRLLEGLGYSLHSLPWTASKVPAPMLQLPEFAGCRETNFIAHPNSGLWKL
jgi:FkbM family methyltransferase